MPNNKPKEIKIKVTEEMLKNPQWDPIKAYQEVADKIVPSGINKVSMSEMYVVHPGAPPVVDLPPDPINEALMVSDAPPTKPPKVLADIQIQEVSIVPLHQMPKPPVTGMPKIEEPKEIDLPAVVKDAMKNFANSMAMAREEKILREIIAEDKRRRIEEANKKDRWINLEL